MADKLIRMANQIADFFRSQPGGDQARDVADHLNSFWPVTMRMDLHAALAASADADPLVRDALVHLRLPDDAE